MKLLLCGVLTLASALVGRGIALAEAERVRNLRALADSLEKLQILMLEQLKPLAMALYDTGYPLFMLLAGEEKGGDAQKAWRRICDGGAQPQEIVWMKEPEKKVLSALFAALGGAGSQTDRATIDAAERELRRIGAEAAVEEAGKPRLYTVLGALMGLAASVMAL